jgi:hypothetical protein
MCLEQSSVSIAEKLLSSFPIIVHLDLFFFFLLTDIEIEEEKE